PVTSQRIKPDQTHLHQAPASIPRPDWTAQQRALPSLYTGTSFHPLFQPRPAKVLVLFRTNSETEGSLKDVSSLCHFLEQFGMRFRI
ncbi:hypothetical protein, partial [Salmonella sp. SAL4433]|uniref:hypothetical protein n=1 Tax=Salmonella sp. SAL4433 TaxID=3159888 RepID=UPI00397937B7